MTAAGMLAVFCAAFAAPPAALAQEEVVTTPPELRDFKLDPDKPAQPLPPSNEPPSGNQPTARSDARPRPADAPPASDATRPAPVLTIPDPTPDFVREGSSRTAPPASSARINEPLSTVQNAPVDQREAAQTGTDIASTLDTGEAASETTSAAEQVSDEATIQSSDIASSDILDGQQSGWALWQILAGSILALLSAAAIFWLFRRRRQAASDADWMTAEGTEVEPEIQLEPISEPVRVPEITPTFAAPAPKIARPPRDPIPAPPIITTASLAHAVKSKPEPKPEPILVANFAPLRATISIANLTIKGALSISNIGDIPAQSIMLRTRIISASEDQDQHIAAFHADHTSSADQLGDAVAGENIDMEIDLIIPLYELKTYALKERKLFVPIVLVNVEYGPPSARQQLRLSCLIGREATPPKPKMGPFRLDLGPRSFAALGQRPLFG